MSSKKLYPEGLVGKKLGMTQVFGAGGEMIPVTVIQTGPCSVTEVRDAEKFGYSAVQVGFEEKKQQRVNKPMAGHFKSAGAGAFKTIKELRFDKLRPEWATLGAQIKAGEIFQEGEYVDITGTTKGKGFAGVVRRYRMKGQPATRGTHETRRNVGSVGCRKTPGRIFKNKRMPGHMGNVNVTVQNLQIVSLRTEDNLLLVKGAVPGPKGGIVVVKRAIKGYEAAEANAS